MTTQKSMNDKIKGIIDKGIPFTKKDHNFLLQIIKYHPNPEKIDEVENVLLNNRGDGLLIQYSDLTTDTISYKKCVRKMLTGKNAARENIREAFRNEIYVEQIVPFRKQHGKTFDNEYHVGHGSGIFSFDSLVKRFCENNFLKEEDIIVVKKKVRNHYECNGYFLSDENISKKWKNFHKQSSNLIMQTAQENLRESI